MKLDKILEVLNYDEYWTIHKALIEKKVNNEAMNKTYKEIYERNKDENCLTLIEKNEKELKIIKELIKIKRSGEHGGE